MRTATIEAVLGPVAEAIGEFLIANEEAELNDIPLGDLTPVAEGVGLSVKGLLDVAHSLATSTTDQDLKIEMPLACQEVENAVDGLKSSSFALKHDPLNIVQRALMIESAKGILNGTAKVLECFDDYEVRKIVRACQDARLQVTSMRKVESVNDLVSVIQPACQSLITLAQLADKRVSELLDPWTKVSLTQAREVIKGSSTLMVSSTKAYVTNIDKPSKESAKESRELCMKNLQRSIDDVERIVQIKQVLPQEKSMQTSPLAKDRLAARNALIDIHNAVVAQSPEALQAAFRIFDPATNNILANARAIAANLQDPQKKAEILNTVANIERLRKEIEAAAKYAMAHPDDVEAQKRLVDLLKQADAEFDKLDKLINEALYDDIQRSLNAMGSSSNPDATLAKLIAAAHAGDIDGVNAQIRKLESEAAALKKLADQVAERTTDPQLARAIRDAQKYVDNLLPQVIAAAKTVALNPNDPAARDHLTAVVSEWETGVSRLKDAIHDAQSNEDIVSASAQAIKFDLAKFQEACKKQDANMLKEASQGITQKIQAVTAAAQREIENSSDPEYQQTLRNQIADLQKILPELQLGAKAAFSNPNNAAAHNALKQTGDRLVNKMYDIKDTIHVHNNPADQEKWQELDRHIQETRRREEEKRAKEAEQKRIEEEIRKRSEAEQAALRKAAEERRKAEERAAQEEARKAAEEEAAFLREQEALRLTAESLQKSNPIKAAALDLKIEANKWESEGNILIKMSQSLAENMALLSELAQLNTPDAKKRLIEVARKIAEDSKVIEKEAKRIAANCTDKRLQQDLNIVADRVGTIANQIKILSTVKAANPNDHDNDQMLITAATNLMSSVKITIDASQSAQIRSVKTAATVVTAALKWKRKAANARTPTEPTSLASLMSKSKLSK